MPGGRPTIYDPKYIDEILAYFSQEPFTFENGKRIPIELPTKAGFAARIGIHRGTLKEWCDKYPEFSSALSKGIEHQERILFANALTGGYNPVIAKLMATNNLGYREKQEIDHTTGGQRIDGLSSLSPEVRLQMTKLYEEDLKNKLTK